MLVIIIQYLPIILYIRSTVVLSDMSCGGLVYYYYHFNV
jgi:hypothetical protein